MVPRRAVHDGTGAVAGVGAWLVVLYSQGALGRTVDALLRGGTSLFDVRWVDLLVLVVFAWFGSRLPDVLEPPVGPRHRGVLHGLRLFLVLTVLAVFWVWVDGSLLSRLALGLVFGYDSHLVLDAVA